MFYKFLAESNYTENQENEIAIHKALTLELASTLVHTGLGILLKSHLTTLMQNKNHCLNASLYIFSGYFQSWGKKKEKNWKRQIKDKGSLKFTLIVCNSRKFLVQFESDYETDH